jgi:hypothetical protein
VKAASALVSSRTGPREPRAQPSRREHKRRNKPILRESTISESLPATAPRDQVAPATPLAERPLVAKLRAASTGEGRNLRARLQFGRVALLLQGGGALGAAEHWRSGYHDAMRALRHPEVLERAGNGDEFTIFDFASDGD